MKNGDIARNVGHNIAEGVSHIVETGRKVVVDTAATRRMSWSSNRQGRDGVAKAVRNADPERRHRVRARLHRDAIRAALPWSSSARALRAGAR